MNSTTQTILENAVTATLPDTPSQPLSHAAQHAAQHGAAQAPLEATRLRIRLWDLPTRLFHWFLVVAVITAIISGQIGGDWMRVHGIAGLGIVGLVVFRLVWGFIGSTHARFQNFVPTPSRLRAYFGGRWQGLGHNPLGALSVIALLGLLALQAGTGLFSNDDISFAGPLAVRISDELSARLTGWHHQLSTVLMVLAGLHVLAIGFYVFFRKNNLVKPMITGYKEVESGEHARQGGWLAFVFALAVALVAVYLANGAAWPGR